MLIGMNIINILILFYTLVDTAKSILQQSEIVANCSGKQYVVSKKVLTGKLLLINIIILYYIS